MLYGPIDSFALSDLVIISIYWGVTGAKNIELGFLSFRKSSGDFLVLEIDLLTLGPTLTKKLLQILAILTGLLTCEPLSNKWEICEI